MGQAVVNLQVVVAEHCPGCDEATRMYERVREARPEVSAELIDLAATPERKPEPVVAVPSYVINGRLAFAGNPRWEELVERLAAATEAGSTADCGLQVYGTRWCGDCWRSKRLLDRAGVPYKWVDIDRDPEAARYVMKVNGGLRRVPTIVFPDGSVLVEPSDATLAEKIGYW